MLSPQATYYLSILVLLLVAVGLVALPVLRARQTGYPLSQYLVYTFGFLMTRLLWRAEIVGRLPVEHRGGLVIICNHRSPFDPAFIQLAADRVVHWMVAREYCEFWLSGWLLRIVQVIPVGRGGVDTAATKMAIRYAEGGQWIGMLPEGRINTTDALLLSGRPGAALVAMKARVPVVPCFIRDAPMGATIFGSLLLPAHTRLVIGEMLDISAYYGREREPGALQELTKHFLREIARLGGEPEFEPELAGRNWKPED